jgi:hypothetical protein
MDFNIKNVAIGLLQLDYKENKTKKGKEIWQQ